MMFNGSLQSTRLNNNSQVMVRLGPGIWYSLHILSLDSDTEEKQHSMCETMKVLFSSLPCGKCRGHATEYYRNNNPQDYIGKTYKTRGGMTKPSLAIFYYVWEMHNSVNNRLGKREWTFGSVYDYYVAQSDYKKDPNPFTGKVHPGVSREALQENEGQVQTYRVAPSQVIGPVIRQNRRRRAIIKM